MSEYSERAREAIQATASPRGFLHVVRRGSPSLPSRVRRALTARTARSYLLTIGASAALPGLLSPWVRIPGGVGTVVTAPAGRAPFILLLSEANSGQGYKARADGSSRGLTAILSPLLAGDCGSGSARRLLMGTGLSPSQGRKSSRAFPRNF